ncbi:MAG TPA: hypothetical protein VGD97_05555 [Lacunisphaera sp.]
MKNLLLPLVALPTLASALSGQVLGARTAGANQTNETALARGGDAAPARPAAPVTVSRRFVESDGFTITKLVLAFDRGAQIGVTQPRLGDWQRRDRAPFAIAFVHPLAADACLGISYYSGPAAARLLAGAAWAGTPTSLPRNAKDVSRVLVNDDSAVNGNMLRPLSWRTRVFEREITAADPDLPPQRQVLVAIGDDTQAYLFTLEGNASQVAGLKGAFERVVTGFELVN